jgi:tetratricopeptide (TPR) repeat protein
MRNLLLVNRAFPFLSIALALMSTVAVVSSAGEEHAPRPLTLTYPGLEWCLTVHPGALHMDEKSLRDDLKGAMLAASNEASGLMMTIYLERQAQSKDSNACRDHYWAPLKQNPPQEENVTMYERGEMAMLEYMLNEPGGHPIHQKNLDAYIARDGACIDIHVSKVQYKPVDRVLFDDVLKGIGFRKVDSYDHLGLASYFYTKKDYKSAIGEYRMSIDLEAKEPRMEKNEWRVAVDNMGMAYGVSGDLTRAKETFVYGLSKDPQYPMFYYNLACTFGEMNDLDNAVVNLKKAHENRDNMIPGETLPDPGKDSSFERFLSAPKFQEILRLFHGAVPAGS